MEIGIFSKCVKDLIVDLDQVGIPGLGVFFAENVPASFSDKGNTINPPSRKMYFRREVVPFTEDIAILATIRDLLDVTPEQAKTELDWCLSRIHSELSGNRSCLLPGLGEMKSTSGGEYFFIPEENLDICAESFGLEPVSVKIPAVPADATPEPPAQPKVQTQPKEQPQPKPRRGHVALTIILILILILIVAAIIGFRFFPEEMDEIINTLLYTPEELEVLGR